MGLTRSIASAAGEYTFGSDPYLYEALVELHEIDTNLQLAIAMVLHLYPHLAF